MKLLVYDAILYSVCKVGNNKEYNGENHLGQLKFNIICKVRAKDNNRYITETV